MKLHLALLFLFIAPILSAQHTIITGKVTEVTTGAPVPFANVVIKGTTIGTSTDFDGFYKIETSADADSLVVSYIGFIPRAKPFIKGATQLINFQLDEQIVSLDDLVIYAGENPAYEILRNVVNNKKLNDKRSLEAYQFENYTKIEIGVDNISDKFRNRKVVQKITSVLDSIEVIAGEDGKPILPIFISEALSTVYYRSSPQMKYENIYKTKLTGVGITDGTLTSQVIGGSFQEYNFYQNWMNIVGKEFISPVADGWRLYYDYELVDSLYLEDHYCYRLDFWPKRDQDLAFHGTMWITKEQYAIRRIDVSVNKSANLNFIEKIKIQQDLKPTAEGPWLPEKYRVVVDVSQITNETAGLIAKFYVSTKDIALTKPKSLKFYEAPITMEEDVRMDDELFWQAHRHDSLSSTEQNLFQMIDTLKTIPIIKTYTDIVKTIGTFYYRMKYVDLGPYTAIYGQNNIEGLRLGFGARTNIDFSKKWVFQYRFGYGFDDERWKHKANIKYIVSRKPWTTLDYEYKNDIEAIWALNNGIENSALLYAVSRFGNLQEPFMVRKNAINFNTQISKGWSQQVGISNQYHEPLFDFRYYESPGQTDSQIGGSFTTTELSFETRFARDELFVINDNDRLSLGTIKWPAINVRYTLGLKNALGGDFDYHKLEGRIAKTQKMGFLGVSDLELAGGYIFSQLPYPLLKNHIGNPTSFYSDNVYNMMEFFEFTSDHHVSMRVRHHFEGLLLNKIPLIKKLKWRMTATANVLFGGVRQENYQVIPPKVDEQGNSIAPFKALDFSKPYVELGYGIENIFRVLRIDAFHRITYLENTNANKFGLKFSLQLIL